LISWNTRIHFVRRLLLRLLMHVKIPHAKFNASIKDGTVGQQIIRTLNETKSETAYFTEYDGHRNAILIVNPDDLSKIPALAEPWFLIFDADVQFHIVMSPEELGRASLETIAMKWA
jgi:hypothetical protein